jgi:hypothetical protein
MKLGEFFTHHGREFKWEIVDDDNNDPPWERSDGHGVVSEWTTRAKRAGERVLITDYSSYRHYYYSSYRYYDVVESTKRAKRKRDGWGLGDEAKAKLAKELCREPTKGEIIARAVENDYEFLRGWCNDEWRYVGVVVMDLESGDEDSLWGIESSSDDYLVETALDLASGLHPLANANEAAALEICTD